jgi:hypothetical protein
MAELKFTKGTDEEHEIELDSYLISACWNSGRAYAGQKARFSIQTALVGNGAKIKIKGKSEEGKKMGKVSGEIYSNVYVGEFDLPEDIKIGDKIYFEVKLPRNNLEGESERIPVLPIPKIKEIGWSAPEARRGDIVTLSAELEEVRDYTEVKLIIYEHDQDGAHDRINEIPGIVKDGKVEVKWEYEYHEDTDEVPTEEELKRYGRHYNPPEYFFTIKFDDLELGRGQESGLLLFKDWINIELIDREGNPIPNEEYILRLPDGHTRRGKLDNNGQAQEEDIPPGSVFVEFPDSEDEADFSIGDQKGD